VSQQNNGHEHEFEPELGLPEPLPAGEKILWQGAPDFSDMLVRVFHFRKLSIYFLLMLLMRAGYLSYTGQAVFDTLFAMIWPTGLALVGHYLNTIAPVLTRIDAALAVRGGVANSDIVRSYVGLLVQGKSDTFRHVGVTWPESTCIREERCVHDGGRHDICSELVDKSIERGRVDGRCVQEADRGLRRSAHRYSSYNS
jgi:hypothetical protein